VVFPWLMAHLRQHRPHHRAHPTADKARPASRRTGRGTTGGLTGSSSTSHTTGSNPSPASIGCRERCSSYALLTLLSLTTWLALMATAPEMPVGAR
jgi:hypothetical protein